MLEVHTWSDRPGKFWQTQGKPKPSVSEPVPHTLDWNLWLGPAAARPYHSSYAPKQWRGFYDFGCGALGDMMVQNADPSARRRQSGLLVFSFTYRIASGRCVADPLRKENRMGRECHEIDECT